ncbi:tetratricopeptide repeat protein [Plastoroseomonas hellenica]|uniref:tetratricopeptide repeat protein n=1 Tax=Plastoroseomonas hellenica TaxID=2687306 RepID=UPI001BA79C72|nr:sel1 repeat family protein [Plastoroseomonas hellenica]MBR0643887.1 sel1 repeat family protein [Plastoroseomonas hellenica]
MAIETVPPRDLVEQAEAGEAEAQSSLGRWYADVAGDIVSAKAWFARAAEQGLGKAIHNLGILALRDGEFELATRHLARSARQGWLPSFFVLGQILESDGREQDAVRLYEDAASQGDVACQDALGRRAFDEEDFETALHWTRKAAEAGGPWRRHGSAPSTMRDSASRDIRSRLPSGG